MKNSYMMKVLRVGSPQRSYKADSPEIAVRYWRRVIARQSWFDPNKEHLVALNLSTQYHILGYSLASIGTVNEAIAHPRDIFRAAIAAGAFGIIVMHNHPSGEAKPSQTDRSLFRRLYDAGDLLQIRVLDQIVIGAGRAFYSDLAYLEALEEAKRKRRSARQRAAKRRRR
jgi:DNA repair protein RadC